MNNGYIQYNNLEYLSSKCATTLYAYSSEMQIEVDWPLRTAIMTREGLAKEYVVNVGNSKALLVCQTARI